MELSPDPAILTLNQQKNHMQKIDIDKLIKTRGLDRQKLAADLFPMHKHPDRALTRFEEGKTSLNSEQISRLAFLLECTIAELFTGERWKGRVRGDTHTLTTGDYTAVLNTTTWVTRLWHKDTLYHESVIHSEHIPLSEYIHMLDELILNHNIEETEE